MVKNMIASAHVKEELTDSSNLLYKCLGEKRHVLEDLGLVLEEDKFEGEDINSDSYESVQDICSVPDIFTKSEELSDSDEHELVIDESGWEEDKKSENANNGDVNKRHECFICKKVYPNQKRLINHIRNHTMTRNFPCIYCSKSFTSSSNLQAHTRVHSGERPYQCKICLKYFSQLGNLRTHEYRHTGLKQFRCHICMISYSSSSYLNTHMRTHIESFFCNICKKRFSSSSYLQKHYLIHSGIKPFSCDSCKKSFSFASNLRKHVMDGCASDLCANVEVILEEES